MKKDFTFIPYKEEPEEQPRVIPPAEPQEVDGDLAYITPELITELQPNEVFTFGSNLAGRHGKGAAKLAMKWGAVYGQAHGLQGKTYAIPTLDVGLMRRALGDIAQDVYDFTDFAERHQELTFLVTEIGCGLAGFKHAQIAPLFTGCNRLKNVKIPLKFWKYI